MRWKYLWLMVAALALAGCRGESTLSPDTSDASDTRDDTEARDSGEEDATSDTASSDTASADTTNQDTGADDTNTPPDTTDPGGCAHSDEAFTVAVNFEPPGYSTPSGYRSDSGAVYDAGRGYGWSSDISDATRARSINSDPTLDTAIFPGAPGRVDTWELDVPNGEYRVSLRSGDPLAEQGPTRIVAEGEVLIDSQISASGEFLAIDDRIVEVCDGTFTLEVGDGAADSALNRIEVRSTNDSDPQCTPQDEVCNNRDDDCDQQIDEDGVCDPPDPSCVQASLADAGSISGAGYSQRGGVFRDGGWAVESTCDQITRSFSGDYSTGSISFDAKGLFHAIPDDPNNHGCERFIFNINRGSSSGPSHSRMWFASMEAGCAGAPRGNLRVGLAEGQCCNDSGRLPDSDDGNWHSYEVSWTPSRITVTIDGQTWVDGGSGGAHVGSGIDLEFGSECAPGDETGAVFRDLEVCKGQ